MSHFEGQNYDASFLKTCCYEFLNFPLILAIKKRKKILERKEILRIENLKYDKTFHLFVRFEQKSKTEVRKQPFKCS